MTVSNTDRHVVYTGNGATVDFPFAFWIQKPSDIGVLLKEIATGDLTIVSPSLYTVTGISLTSQLGGSVHYPVAGSPLSSAYKLIIVRSVAYTQELDISNQGGFLPEPVEFQLDRIEMQIQQLAERSNRSVAADIDSPGLAIEDIPVGHIWKRDPLTRRMIDGGDASNIADAQAYAEAAAQSALDAAVFGSPAFYITPGQYFAPSDGVTDARTGLFNADAAAAAAGKPLVITNGTFLINSNLTFTSRVVFVGGKLKPNAGVNVTFSGMLEAPPYQIFDTTTLGGTILGSPILPDGKVYGEWWGANPFNAAFNSQPALQKAVNFIAQRSVSGGAAKGAILQLLTGWYRLESSVAISSRGISVLGCGPLATYCYIIGNIHGWTITGAQDGSLASYGTRFEGIQFYGDTTKPIGGSQLLIYKAQEFIIRDCWFTNFFNGINCQNCQGALAKRIIGNNFVTSGGLPATTSSACILLRGEFGGTGTGLSENFIVEDNIGAPNICIDFGVFLDGCDTVYLTNNHFAGQATATLYIASSQCNLYNIHSANNCWEGLNAYSNYAVYIANGGANTMNDFNFSTDQFLNGVTAMFAITGTSTNIVAGITVGNCQFLQAINHGVTINNAHKVNISDNTLIDGDILGAGSKSWFVIGGGVTDPDDVNVSGNMLGTENSGTGVASAFTVLGGTGIMINENTIRNATVAFANSIGKELMAENNRTSLSTSVASGTTIAPPLGIAKAYITGGTTIDFIAAGSKSKDRRLSLRAPGALTVRNGIGASGFVLSGAANYVMANGNWLHVTYDDVNDRWIETGRC